MGGRGGVGFAFSISHPLLIIENAQCAVMECEKWSTREHWVKNPRREGNGTHTHTQTNAHKSSS
jgi:hypothetical protein